MFISWFNILILAALCGLFLEVGQITVMSAVFFLIKMLYGGILLYMTITPVIYLSIRNKGFVTPFVAVAAVCLLNVIMSNSPVAGLYPWTASWLLVSGHGGSFGCPPVVSLLLIALLCVLSMAASMKRFLGEDIG